MATYDRHMPHSQYTGEAAVTSLMNSQTLELRCRGAIVTKSYEGCLADGALMLAGHGQAAWPTQIKTTRVWNKVGRSRNRQFKFQGTSKYPGCLVVCCALLQNETLCWLIPGDALTKVKTLTVTERGKWDAPPYAVASGNLVAAMLDRVRESWWVSCSAHDATYFEPQTVKQRLEVQGLRELMRFRGMRLSFPPVEHGVVDCVLRQEEACFESQCKTAFHVKRLTGFRVDLVKQRSGVKVPYEQGDFKMLVVHLPGDPNHKFFIPAAELSQRGFFSDSNSGVKGKMTLGVGAPGHWTSQFLKGRDELICAPLAADLAARDTLPAAPVVDSVLPAILSAVQAPAQYVAALDDATTPAPLCTLTMQCTSMSSHAAHHPLTSPAPRQVANALVSDGYSCCLASSAIAAVIGHRLSVMMHSGCQVGALLVSHAAAAADKNAMTSTSIIRIRKTSCNNIHCNWRYCSKFKPLPENTNLGRVFDPHMFRVSCGGLCLVSSSLEDWSRLLEDTLIWLSDRLRKVSVLLCSSMLPKDFALGSSASTLASLPSMPIPL